MFISYKDLRASYRLFLFLSYLSLAINNLFYDISFLVRVRKEIDTCRSPNEIAKDNLFLICLNRIFLAFSDQFNRKNVYIVRHFGKFGFLLLEHTRDSRNAYKKLRSVKIACTGGEIENE